VSSPRAGDELALLEADGLPTVLADPVFDGHPSPTITSSAVGPGVRRQPAAPPLRRWSRQPLSEHTKRLGGGAGLGGGVAAGAALGAHPPGLRRGPAGVLGVVRGDRAAAGAGGARGSGSVGPGPGADPLGAHRAGVVAGVGGAAGGHAGRVLPLRRPRARLEFVAGRAPGAAAHRPEVTLGPTQGEVAALLAAAEADSPRAAALVSLLVHTGLRIDEALSRDVANWGVEQGASGAAARAQGRVEGRTVLPGPVVRALRAYLGGRNSGPLFATGSGRRLDQPAAWRLLRRLATAAGIDPVERVSPHGLRHGSVTLALDAYASLRDVQDAAGHANPATTRGYDTARGRLDRHPAYVVGAHLAAIPARAGALPSGRTRGEFDR
jgi:integrase-like protein